MEKLLIIFIVSFNLISCGKNEEQNSEKIKTTSAIERENQLELINFDKISFEGSEILFKNGNDHLKEEYFTQLRVEGFRQIDKASLPKTKITLPELDENKTLFFQLNSPKDLCSVELMIQSDDLQYVEKLNEYSLQKNSFFLDLNASKKYEIEILDYRYCRYPQSFMERIAELRKTHYFIHFLEDERQKIIPVEESELLAKGLKLIDPAAEIKFNRLEKFLTKKNTLKQYPINNNTDEDSLWFIIGLEDDSTNTSIQAGKVVSLVHFKMAYIREKLTTRKVQSFTNHKFSLNEIKGTQIKDLEFHVKEATYQLESKKYKSVCFGSGFPSKCKYREYTLLTKYQGMKSFNISDLEKINEYHLSKYNETTYELLPSKKVKFKLGTKCVKYCSGRNKFINKYGEKVRFDLQTKEFPPQLIIDVHYSEETIAL